MFPLETLNVCAVMPKIHSVISRNLTPQQLGPAARMGYKILRAVITISRTDADVALNKDKKKAGGPGAK